MNYRQWKKKYKKTHGHNPPLSEDRRKQAKLVARQLDTLLPNIVESVSNITTVICEALADICKGLSDGFASAGETFENIASNNKTSTNFTQ